MQIRCRFHHEQITCTIFALLSRPLLWYIIPRQCVHILQCGHLTPVHFAVHCSYVWSSWMVLFRFLVPNFYGGSMWNTRCMAVQLTIKLSYVKLCFVSLIPPSSLRLFKSYFLFPSDESRTETTVFLYWYIYPSVILRFKLQLLPRMKGFKISSIHKCIHEHMVSKGRLHMKN